MKKVGIGIASSYNTDFRNRNVSQIDIDSRYKLGLSQMIKVILYGTTIVTILLIGLLGISYLLLHNYYVVGRFAIGILILLYLTIAFIQYKKGKHTPVAWMLIGLYTLVGATILYYWGINTPIGTLVLGLVVIISGMMLGAKYIIPTTIGVILTLCLLQTLQIAGVSHPDTSSLFIESNFADIITYGTIFSVLALLAWLSRRQIERAFSNALVAELALQKQRSSLASKVERVTIDLRAAQLQEMQQLYRFAELGQVTALTLHELANQLSVLAIDIDELQEKDRRSIAVQRAKESIRYIDQMIKQVRAQLQNNNESKRFDVIDVISRTLDEIIPRSLRKGIHIQFNFEQSIHRLYAKGDPLRLSQAMIILINNAIEASLLKDSPEKQTIQIFVSSNNNVISISVVDTGIGIPPKLRSTLFEPLKSTKENGLGLGLYITKQIIETHFKGTLTLEPRMDKTEFVIHLKKQ